MKKMRQFNKRESEILQVLWEHEDALSANEIAEISGISKNTVLPVLKKLLNDNYIKVDEVVLTGKTLTRKYLPAIDKEEFVLKHYNLNIDNLLNHFLAEEDDPDVIPTIEKLLKDKKRQFKEDE
ncbi:winged helix-turn-helix transcriptional regulator [Tetragenococcus solitarius]|nr:winged helix-turn-helix transcriptional regulator [Tetragenococcus solitarius]